MHNLSQPFPKTSAHFGRSRKTSKRRTIWVKSTLQKFYQSQQEELQFLLRQLLTHDLYSVLPEWNQTSSMYSHGPSYETRPVNLPDPYETKFMAKTGE